MPFYADVGGLKTPATPENRGAVASCRDCGGAMVPKLGSFVAWHWAHKILPEECRWEGETAWHLRWKKVAADAGYEIEHRANGRIYDAFDGRLNLALEFQRAIDVEDIIFRTGKTPTGRKLLWVFQFGYCGENVSLQDGGRRIKAQVRAGPTLTSRLSAFCALEEYPDVAALLDLRENCGFPVATVPTWLGGYRRTWLAGERFCIGAFSTGFARIRALGVAFDTAYIHGYLYDVGA